MATLVDEHPAFTSQCFWCLFYGGGLIVSLVGYGLLQERIMTVPYSGELFGCSTFIVFSNCVVAAFFSAMMVIYNKEGFGNVPPLWKYLIVSIMNVYACIAQYECLKFLAFVVLMLGKNFKVVPVMLWGTLISGKSYHIEDWLIALATTLGSTGFVLAGPITSDSTGTPSAAIGLLMLLAFVVLDGVTSFLQEQLFREYRTTHCNQMMYVSGMSAIVSLVLLLTMGNLAPSIAFIRRHPPSVWNMLLLGGYAVLGQTFIHAQVTEFGALVFTAAVNLRQVASILMSYLAFGHSISPLQALGLATLFGALFYKSCIYSENPATKEETQPLAEDAKDSSA